MRRLLRDIAAGNELGDVSTLRDPEVVGDLQEQVKGVSRCGVGSSTPNVRFHPV